MIKNNNLKSVFLFIALAVTTLGMLIIFAISLLSSSYLKFHDAEKNRYQSYLLADELRQSSDDLTRLARTYVITGNPLYKKQYEDILEIRDGNKPRPLKYERIYWDYLAVAGSDLPRPDGKAMSLTQLMINAEFSDAEMAKLKEAKDNSDALVYTERVAMDAVLANKKIKQHAGQQNISKAVSMMHDDKYHKDKLLIMQPVSDFFALLDQRTLSASQAALQLTKDRKVLIYGLIGTSLLILYLIFIFSYKALANSQLAQLSAKQDTQKRADELGIANDLLKTQNKEKEKQTAELIKAKVEAENANLVKSQFLSSMSHELRTPLNAILGFSQLLEIDEKNPKKRENIQEIISGGNHLLDLINQILDLAKIESGNVELSIENYSLKKILNDSLSMIKPFADKHAIQIDNKVSSLPDINISVDAMRFKQIILNLLSNAIKYNSENGKVTIDSSSNDNNMLCLSINDTGNGFTAEQLSNLFEPFERLGAENHHIEGTGLGLVVAKDLIVLMGGNISVESVAEKGSRFIIQVPLS